MIALLGWRTAAPTCGLEPITTIEEDDGKVVPAPTVMTGLLVISGCGYDGIEMRLL